MEILDVIPLSRVLRMYDVYHEMDIIQFVRHLDTLTVDAIPTTRLKIRRMNCNLSQSELAASSGVALRQIQLFEQRQRDINNAAAITLLKLSKALHCNMSDLMEYQDTADVAMADE